MEERRELEAADGHRHTLVLPDGISEVERTKALRAWGWLEREEWNRKYAEAVRWRDWDTCEYLLSVKPAQLDAAADAGTSQP